MKEQIENPALLNRRFVFDVVLFLDVSFHILNLTRVHKMKTRNALNGQLLLHYIIQRLSMTPKGSQT